MKNLSLTCLCLSVLSITACKKDKEETPVAVNTLRADVLDAFSKNVAAATYADLYSKTLQLQSGITSFTSNATQTQLEASRNDWRTARAAWEQSEAFLFGPVATENVDPRIDTWPINTVDLENVMANNDSFPQSLVNNLPDELKGFHPIEFLLFGQDGNKLAADFTEKEKSMLAALAQNLSTLTQTLDAAWNPANA